MASSSNFPTSDKLQHTVYLRSSPEKSTRTPEGFEQFVRSRLQAKDTRPLSKIALKQHNSQPQPGAKNSQPGAKMAFNAFPQTFYGHLTRSTESTDSQESVMTQVPLPYHMANSPVIGYGNYVSQSQAPQGQIGEGGAYQISGVQSQASVGRLDPSSSPYVPTPQAYPAQLAQPSGGYTFDGNMNGNAAYGGQQVGYAGANQAGMMGMGMGMGAPPVGGYANSALPNPYAHFGAAGMGAENMGYASPGNGMNMGMSVAPSPGMSYSGVNMGYPPAGMGYGAGMVSPPSNNGYAAGYTGGYNDDGYASQGTGMYQNPSNANRGPVKANYTPLVRSYPMYKNGRPASNLATAPVQVATGTGSVQAPSTGSDVNSKASTRESSQERSSVSIGSDSRSNADPTPTPTKHRPDNHSTETPTLRSRRNQSIDGNRHGVMTQWLENLPAGADKNSSPPKMLSLLAAGGVDASVLAPINETDPFSPQSSSTMQTPRAVVPFNNPFVSPPTYTPPVVLPPFWVLDLTPPSALINQLTHNGTRRPTYEEAIDKKFFPFMEIARSAKADEHGVVRIKNIPYSVTRSEILAFLGRNARLISETQFEPVHIIMERVTSKTLDCLVEFVNLSEAVQAVQRWENNRIGGRAGRLGQRHVELELSSQEQLMKDLFPKAKNVKWEGGKPVIIPRDPNDKYNSGFQGFISKEELVMLVKHVEAPQRSPFSKDCPQRPFECLISTLRKYPWYMVDYITIDDRIQLKNTTLRLLELLKERIAANREDLHLTPMLFKRVWRAAITCVGFTPTIKDEIRVMCNLDDLTCIEHGMPQFAWYWHPFWTIAQKPNIPQDVVMYYAGLIREVVENKQKLSLAEIATQNDEDEEPWLFGDIKKHLNYPPAYLYCNLSQMAACEWAAIEKLLKEALTPRLTQ